MLVGKSEININELIQHSKTVDEFLEYADSLVPEAFRHVTGILGNQRYLCCLAFRNSDAVSWDKKKEMLPYLFRKSKVCGYIDTVIEVDTLLNLLDYQRLMEIGRKERQDVSCICKNYKKRM